MRSAFLLALPLLVALTLISTPALAFTSYAYNPQFNSNIEGLFIYDEIGVSSKVWNASCTGNSGCLLITTNGTASLFGIYMSGKSTAGYPLTFTSLTELYANDTEAAGYPLEMTLPAYTEGIVSFNYRWNATLTSPVPYLIVDDLTPGNPKGTINSTVLNTTANFWNSSNIIIPPATYNRNLRVRYYFRTDNVVTQIAIDKFKFYTFDLIEPRTSVFTGFADESLRYCGDSNSNALYEEKNATSPYYFETLIDKNEDNLFCGAFQTGNRVVVRQVLNKSAAKSGGAPLTFLGNSWPARDLVYLEGSGGDFPEKNDRLIITRFYLGSSGSMTYSFYGICSGNNYVNELGLNGYGNITWTAATGKICNATGFQSAYNTQIDTTISLAGLNLSGTAFRNYNKYAPIQYSGNLTFPNFQYYSNTSLCSCTDNTQLCLNPPTNYTSTDCGACGCSGNRCRTPEAQGTVCDSTDTTLRTALTYLSDCSSPIVSVCPSGTVCVSYTAINPPENQTDVSHLILPGAFDTVACLNLTNSKEEICINENASQVLCSNISNPTHLHYCVDKSGDTVLCTSFDSVEKFALWVGGFLGSGVGHDLALSETIFALIVTILAGFSGLVLGRNSPHAFSVFLIIFAAVLGIFTIAFSTAYLWAMFIIIILFAIGTLTGAIDKLVYGGKASNKEGG